MARTLCFEGAGHSRMRAAEPARVPESACHPTGRCWIPRAGPAGITVRPPAEWNLYDPQVIRRRLTSPVRAAQLRELRAILAGARTETEELL